MRTDRQFTGTLAPGATRRWFTFNWPARWHTVWYVVPTTPHRGGRQIDWDVSVERATGTPVTYWITVRNATNRQVKFDARYAVLNA